LRLKHPLRRSVSIDASSTPELQKNSAPPPLVSLECNVIDVTRSFPASSAGGCDGLRPHHSKDMTSPLTSDARKKFVSHLREFVNLCLAGKVPSSIQPIFCGASLCALTKKDGGIRSIVVGCTLCRLVAQSVGKVVQEKMAAKMAPVQLGFGVKRGTEASAHAVRRFLQNIGPGQAVLQMDLKNAFNAISRDEMIRITHDILPETFQFVSTLATVHHHTSALETF
jgi:Reverse transcriptase (RNA-dependent DNA polymerase)